MAVTPEEIRNAQSYLTTKGLKLHPARLAAAAKETGRSFDDVVALIRSMAEGSSNQEQHLKERVDTAVRTET